MSTAAQLVQLVQVGAGGATAAMAVLAGGARHGAVAATPAATDDGAWLGPDGPAIAVALDVRGVIAGSIVLIFAERAATQLGGRLLGQVSTVFGEREEAALMELGNIMASSFLNTASLRLRGPAVPGLPQLTRGTLRALAKARAAELGAGWLVHCVLNTSEGVSGHLVLGVDAANTQLIVRGASFV